MIIDCQNNASFTAEDFDVVVVGSGAVGLTAAINLARNGLSVAVLEAGPLSPADASQAFFRQASASGHALPGLHVGRFRAFGGTTNFWGGQLVPFDRHVFEARSWLNADAWPIGIEDLQPYYAQTFKLLGMENVLTDNEIWRELGVSPPGTTAEILPFFTRWAPVSNFAQLFQKEIDERENLSVFINAPVTGFVSSDGSEVAAATVGLGSGRIAEIRGRYFIIANGTIEVCRLLMLPLADERSPNWAENPWLGVGFMDHIDCYAGIAEPIDRRRFAEVFDNAFIRGLKYTPKIRLSPEAQRQHKLLDISAHFMHSSSFSDNIDNLKIFLKGILRGRLNVGSMANPIKTLGALRFVIPMVLRYLRYRRMYNISDGGIMLRFTSEQSPEADSKITLRPDTDGFGVPNVDVSWRFRQKDVETLAKFAELLGDYLAREGLATLVLDERLVAREPDFLKTVDDANHHMGGARMASDPSKGVVDSNLKVFGSTNLFVAGAAVYPSTGFANPTFTAIALGLRLGDAIAQNRT